MVDGRGLQRHVQLGSGAWSGQVSGFFEETPTSQLPIPKPKLHDHAPTFQVPTSAPTAYLRGFLKFESLPIQIRIPLGVFAAWRFYIESANALKPQRRRAAEVWP